jgi:lipopolysaccharide export LptBFGC system permease protein LptF
MKETVIWALGITLILLSMHFGMKSEDFGEVWAYGIGFIIVGMVVLLN